MFKRSLVFGCVLYTCASLIVWSVNILSRAAEHPSILVFMRAVVFCIVVCGCAGLIVCAVAALTFICESLYTMIRRILNRS